MPFELFVLADSPEVGLLNERLNSLLSDEQSMQLYKAFIQDAVSYYVTASRLLDSPYADGQQRKVRVHLACYPNSHDDFFQDLADRTGVSLVDQGEGERGDRMYRLQFQSFSRGALAVLMAEVNSPGLPQSTLPQALDALQTASVVLGPTERGSVYLLGCLGMGSEILQDIAWDTTAVRDILRTRFTRDEQDVAELREFWSITRPEDLVRIKRLLDVEPGRAPATAKVLRGVER